MNIVVYGLYHLGCVTAACLATKENRVIGLSVDAQEAAALSRGQMPIYEPGLSELVQAGVRQGNLKFTADPHCVETCDVVWVCFDTPVDNDDIADTEYVLNCVRLLFPFLKNGTVVLISSQLPVGSVAVLEKEFKLARPDVSISFACSPENLRLGNAINVFLNSERIVIGIREAATRVKLDNLLAPFCQDLIWISVESAEMTKHALNVFLALSVTYANEVARLCEFTGAQMGEVEKALRAEPRVGRRAYIRPGSAFGGGTLARDVQFLHQLSGRAGESVPVLSHILESNRIHKQWPIQRLKSLLGSLSGKLVGLLGLSYKPGTDSIRRSVALEVGHALIAEGAKVRAFDPQVVQLPKSDRQIAMVKSAADLFVDVDAVIITTEWPEFRALSMGDMVHHMRTPVILDQNGFLEGNCSDITGLTYAKVGVSL